MNLLFELEQFTSRYQFVKRNGAYHRNTSGVLKFESRPTSIGLLMLSKSGADAAAAIDFMSDLQKS
jgi:hypothetical protein